MRVPTNQIPNISGFLYYIVFILPLLPKILLLYIEGENIGLQPSSGVIVQIYSRSSLSVTMGINVAKHI